ncbi:MAG TPA: hypothetical protein VJ983_06940 [candidate division Zixibacteria bacterium]|nr:hypothetical protein [candidate division Zixibacteria bacterium]
MKKYLYILLPLIPALLIYALLAHIHNFTQDDAYISYRYVANYLSGHGLVYNYGERVEGFTNFGWVIYTLFWGALGAKYIFISKLTGFVFGGGVVILTFFIAREILDEKDRWFALIPVYIVACNQSLSYWSSAGLATAAFAFFAMLAVWLYLQRNYLLIFALAILVFLRPDGAVVTGALIVVEAIERRKIPIFTLRCAGAAFVFSIPFVVFKLAYYGSILPNPFYAKTGFRMTQLTNGIEYTGRFMRDYGFYGAALLLPVLVFKRISIAARSVLTFVVLFVLYVTLIGGDVLKVHRFYLPIFGLTSALVCVGLFKFVKGMKKALRATLLILAGVVLCALTFVLADSYVASYNRLEVGFTRKMDFLAKDMLRADHRDFSVAVATIGVFGYRLLGHDVIDMLGLTDSTIARHSEDPVPGMSSTWKEQKHNSKYLLGRRPDYIIFSTGVKPSAPAEKSLLLYPQFLNCYRTIGWYYEADTVRHTGSVQMAYKKVCPIEGDLKPTYPLSFVEDYKTGLDYYGAGRNDLAVQYYDRAISESPKPVYIYLLYQKAFSLEMLRQHEYAEALLDTVVARDSTIFMAQKDLYTYAFLTQNYQKAAIHRNALLKLVPWYVPRLDSLVTRMSREIRRLQQQQQRQQQQQQSGQD